MSGNKTLHKASKAKNDDFYTQISDIERETKHYKQHFKNKIIFCNCDDPEYSNFWRHFHIAFCVFGLKKLVSTHFVYKDLFKAGDTYKMEYVGKDSISDGNFMTGIKTPLKENGDFRSNECIDILKEADVVVTNPPFSLFREYVAQLIEYKKKFLIIGSKNAVSYKEIFKLIKDNKIWLGHGFANGNAYFKVANPRDYASGVYDEKSGLVKFRNISWFTNLDHKGRHEEILLWRKYEAEKYPKYDNYDAIEVGKVADIPMDYDGIMGVPITFLDQYNPEQFEILGCAASAGYNKDIVGIEKISSFKDARPLIKGKNTYVRIFIRRKDKFEK
ncbi:MAG: adenine-specific methyltransferase EcoRI family protein [Elusimicrobiota bacterium]|jgi:hypothetical protein|nr:adenine-specific methyltransferase EcoRI family protein [Elusimicrobiota bacterium]